jgi:hypothetical protein
LQDERQGVVRRDVERLAPGVDPVREVGIGVRHVHIVDRLECSRFGRRHLDHSRAPVVLDQRHTRFRRRELREHEHKRNFRRRGRGRQVAQSLLQGQHKVGDLWKAERDEPRRLAIEFVDEHSLRGGDHHRIS